MKVLKPTLYYGGIPIVLLLGAFKGPWGRAAKWSEFWSLPRKLPACFAPCDCVWLMVLGVALCS